MHGGHFCVHSIWQAGVFLGSAFCIHTVSGFNFVFFPFTLKLSAYFFSVPNEIAEAANPFLTQRIARESYFHSDAQFDYKISCSSFIQGILHLQF